MTKDEFIDLAESRPLPNIDGLTIGDLRRFLETNPSLDDELPVFIFHSYLEDHENRQQPLQKIEVGLVFSKDVDSNMSLDVVNRKLFPVLSSKIETGEITTAVFLYHNDN